MEGSALPLAEALTTAATAINRPGTLQETLDTIVQATRASVPGFDHVGISLTHSDGTLETKSGTGQLVWDLDVVQYDLREGPCYEAAAGDSQTIVAEHIRHDQRWPRYVPRAAQLGLRSQLGIRLFDHEGTIGGLNLYSTEADEVDPDAVHAASLFATHAAIALGHARKGEQMGEALASRKVIGQAIGIIMERYGIDEDRGFGFLVRASTTSNTKLREVAETLVAQGNQSGAQD